MAVLQATVNLFSPEAANDRLTLNARDGADTITVNDLSATDVIEVNINLALNPHSDLPVPDGAQDTIIINATAGDDVIVITGDNSGIAILGLATPVNILNLEANNQIIINGLAATTSSRRRAPANIQFTANGGDGNDILVGSDGPDTLLGEAGDDVLLGGGGLESSTADPVDNTVMQQSLTITASLDHMNTYSRPRASRATGRASRPIGHRPRPHGGRRATKQLPLCITSTGSWSDAVRSQIN